MDTTQGCWLPLLSAKNHAHPHDQYSKATKITQTLQDISSAVLWSFFTLQMQSSLLAWQLWPCWSSDLLCRSQKPKPDQQISKAVISKEAIGTEVASPSTDLPPVSPRGREAAPLTLWDMLHVLHTPDRAGPCGHTDASLPSEEVFRMAGSRSNPSGNLIIEDRHNWEQHYQNITGQETELSFSRKMLWNL